MKRNISIFFVVMMVPLVVFAFGGLVSTKQIIKTNSSTSVPVRLAPLGTHASKVTFIGNNAARTANTGTVYVGPTSTNDTQVLAITTGQVMTIECAPGEWIDLYEWYLDPVTANDGVVILYTQ